MSNDGFSESVLEEAMRRINPSDFPVDSARDPFTWSRDFVIGMRKPNGEYVQLDGDKMLIPVLKVLGGIGKPDE